MEASRCSSIGSPSILRCSNSRSSCGRARLPTWVVRIRSVLRFIGRLPLRRYMLRALDHAVDALWLQLVNQSLLLAHHAKEFVFFERLTVPVDRPAGPLLHHPEQLHTLLGRVRSVENGEGTFDGQITVGARDDHDGAARIPTHIPGPHARRHAATPDLAVD